MSHEQGRQPVQHRDGVGDRREADELRQDLRLRSERNWIVGDGARLQLQQWRGQLPGIASDPRWDEWCEQLDTREIVQWRTTDTECLWATTVHPGCNGFLSHNVAEDEHQHGAV